MKKIHLICAARPNFMKIAPLYHILKTLPNFHTQIVHTGQHYDYQMSQAFFDDFDLPSPHFHLNIKSDTHGKQTAHTIIAYEELCITHKPNLVIVVGDVNATMACTIAAKKLNILVAHLEAGLRSFDRSMPEEINRVVTDSICDFFWTPSIDANENLLREGIPSEKISLVGNIMIDSYCNLREKIHQKKIAQIYNLEAHKFVTMTLHRPVNVDNVLNISNILEVVSKIPMPIIFPVHPRTRKNLEKITPLPQNLIPIDPLGYSDFMSLVTQSSYVISDSGGVQEETTYLRIPCFTLRETTERPVTITTGSNQLVTIENLLEKINHPKQGSCPPLWDGHTAIRIVDIIQKLGTLAK